MARYVVIKHIHPGCLQAVYDRFQTEGRLLPDGLTFVQSWSARDDFVVFQLMDTEDERLFEVWTARWDDLVAFEITRLDPPTNPAA